MSDTTVSPVDVRGTDVVINGVAIAGRWLRDHGDDAESLNPQTKQRLTDTFAIPPDIAPNDVRCADGWLEVDWSDGCTTGHDLAALERLGQHRRGLTPRNGYGFSVPSELELWATPPEVTWFDASVLDDDTAWVEALQHLRQWGWAAFDGVELGDGPTRALAARIGYPRNTIFGDVWELRSGATAHQDSAYESFELDVHADGTYSHDGPGTIIFAQQVKTGDGGNSVLVDAFAAALDFQAADPEAADLLTRYVVSAHYIEPGVHLVAERPALRVDERGELVQVSFNNYDRAPALPEPDIVDAVLDAYAGYRSVFSDAGRALHHVWKPGRMLVFDNWRCFHGRTSFTGERAFAGCYTNHEDLEGAFRVAGLV